MSLLLKLSRSFSVRVTVRLKKVTIPMSVKISQFDKCLFCNGQGRCRCLNCNGRGILMKNGKEYKCSSCCCAPFVPDMAHLTKYFRLIIYFDI